MSNNLNDLSNVKFFTVNEIANILSVSNKTVYRYIELRDLKAVKIFKNIRILESDFKEFLEKNCKKF
ncbi:MAG: Helix-turn-helix domain [Fusobacteriaceae bacterium]|nr:Helix-turn-helix domain [Fusobacteriaceae bacterium]